MSAAADIIELPGVVYLNGWAGRTEVPVKILSATPGGCRVLVRFERSAYRYRAGQTVSAPSRAVAYVDVYGKQIPWKEMRE